MEADSCSRFASIGAFQTGKLFRCTSQKPNYSNLRRGFGILSWSTSLLSLGFLARSATHLGGIMYYTVMKPHEDAYALSYQELRVRRLRERERRERTWRTWYSTYGTTRSAGITLVSSHASISTLHLMAESFTSVTLSRDDLDLLLGPGQGPRPASPGTCALSRPSMLRYVSMCGDDGPSPDPKIADKSTFIGSNHWGRSSPTAAN